MRMCEASSRGIMESVTFVQRGVSAYWDFVLCMLAECEVLWMFLHYTDCTSKAWRKGFLERCSISSVVSPRFEAESREGLALY